MSYIGWDKAIGKKVRDQNGQEIGEVENVNPDSIEVKDGLIAKRHYYIPKDSIQLDATSSNNFTTTFTKQEIKDRFSADNPVADMWKAPKR
jgi:hypothetical protein